MLTGTKYLRSEYQDTCREKGKYVTICEGEIDAMAAYEMVGSKWPVVSIKTNDKFVLTAADLLDKLSEEIDFLQWFYCECGDFLQWFYCECGFGPVHRDVIEYMCRSVTQNIQGKMYLLGTGQGRSS